MLIHTHTQRKFYTALVYTAAASPPGAKFSMYHICIVTRSVPQCIIRCTGQFSVMYTDTHALKELLWLTNMQVIKIVESTASFPEASRGTLFLFLFFFFKAISISAFHPAQWCGKNIYIHSNNSEPLKKKKREVWDAASWLGRRG